MRSLGILIVAACLMAGCEEIPTTPTAGNQTTTTASAGSNQQTSTATNSSSTGHDAQGTIKDGKIDIQMPDGEIKYN